MWSALVLQTLRKDTLEKYLPGETLTTRAGCRLNVASPLRQRSEIDRVGAFNDLINSDTPAREFAKQYAEEYRSLRFSDEKLLRDYWWGNAQKSQVARVNAAKVAVRERMRVDCLNGADYKVSINAKSCTQSFTLCNTFMTVSCKLARLAPDQPVHVQCFLSETPAEDCYARDSRPTDDGSRLVIRFSGTTIDGGQVDGVVRVRGLEAVAAGNSIYDIMVGRTIEESRSLEDRRYLIRGKGEKGKKGPQVLMYSWGEEFQSQIDEKKQKKQEKKQEKKQD